MNRIFGYLIILSCIFFANSFSQKQINFVNLNIENGLSSNTINGFAQDSLGFLWIATSNGLNRYDASKFKVYRYFENNSNSLRSNNIFALLTTKNNELFIGTLGGGLSIYNRDNDNFENYLMNLNDTLSISSNNVRTIYEAKNGDIWIGTENGLNKFYRKSKTFKRYYFNLKQDYNNFANQIWDITQTSDSVLWLGSLYGLIKFNIINNKYEIFKNDQKNPNSLSHNFIFSIENCKDSLIYLGTYNGLNEFNIYTNENKRIYFNNLTDKINNISSLKFYKNELWCATKDGLVEFDPITKTYSIYKNNIIDRKSIISDKLNALFVDSFEIMWIGTEEGISYYDPTRYKFLDISKVIIRDEGYDILNRSAKAILETSNIEVWIGTSEGIAVVNYLGQIIKLNDKINQDCKKCLSINSLYQDSKNRIWVGTESGIYIYDSETKKFVQGIKNYLLLPHPNISKIYEYPNLNFWIGTNGGGLLNFNERTKELEFYSTFYDDKKLASDFVSDIICFDDQIIVGSYNNGITIIDLKSGAAKILNQSNSNIPSNNILCFKIYKDNLLVGSNNGLFTLNPKLGKAEIILPGEMIKGLEIDDEGYFWIALSDGLVKFSQHNGILQKYTFKDGLLSQIFSEKSLYKGTSGIMYIGSSNGMNYFIPEKIIQNTKPPKLVFTNISIVGDLTGEIEKYFLGKNVNLAQEISLPYNKNYLMIEWAAIHFTFPEKNISRYKLEGYDEAWISAGNRNLAIYSNLPPGSYIFKVQASNSDGYWNPKELTLLITINPPIWKTTYAYVLYLLSFMSFIYLLIWYTNYRKQKEIDVLTKADKIKDEFLAQMSHEIRTPISAILSFTRLIKEDVREYLNDELKESFEIIESAGRRIMRTVDLILSMSEIKLGTYKAKLEYVDLYPIIQSLYNEYKNRAKEKDLEIELIKECDKSTIFADSFTVLKIFDNLLDNAVKFTNEGKIQIRLKQDEQHVAVEVIDTGVGISEEYMPHLFEPFSQEETGYTRRYDGNGLGLALVKKYCDLNNAEIKVDSKKGLGSKFIVKFKQYDYSTN